MKGLTHFTVGVAVAAAFPASVAAAADGNPLYFLLGGIGGLLPDTLDFKLMRFAYRHDMEVIPDPLAPDPALIAGAVAQAIDRAQATGRPVRIKLSTIRLGANAWLQYRITLDPAGRRVTADWLGPVSTRRSPLPGHGASPLTASAPLNAPVALDYEAVTEVDIFDGPVFEMAPLPDGRVQTRFIPWHRAWSHSLVVAAVLGVAVAPLAGAAAGLVFGLAYAAHALTDQLGFMGSNLFFPFTRRRVSGLQWTHSANPFANFAVIWVALLLAFWNLARFTPGNPVPYSLAHLLLYGAALPLAALRLLDRLLPRSLL